MKRAKGLVIAIDGPAGAGKSTVTKLVARNLGLHYLDTGAMYRCVALLASRAGLGPDDAEAAALAESCRIEFADDGAAFATTGVLAQRVLLNGEDVSDAIRTLEIGELASALSAHPTVRRALVKKQQAIVSEGGYTLEGRDAATVIAPNAELKIYLTASLEVRAQRRLAEFQAKSPGTTLEEVKEAIAARDHRDSTRADSPLRIAEGAVVVDTSEMTIEQVVARIEELALSASADKA